MWFLSFSFPVWPLAVSRSPSDFISPWTPYEQHPVPIKYLGAYPFLYLPCLTACLLVWFAFPALKALPYWSQSISYLVPNGSSSFTLRLCMRTCISLWKCPVIKMNPLVEMSTKELYIFKCGQSPMTGLYWHYMVAHALKHWAPLFEDYCRLWPAFRRSAIASGFGVEKLCTYINE